MKVNKHHEQDYVGMRTIEIINEQSKPVEKPEEKPLKIGISVANLHKPISNPNRSEEMSHLTQPKSLARIVGAIEPSQSLTGITASNNLGL